MMMILTKPGRKLRPLLLAAGLLPVLAGCGGGASDELPPASAYRFDADTVRTSTGTVGATDDSTAAVRIFKAIPYAAPPLGALRWAAPRAAAAWTGTRRNNDFSAACMQNQGTTLTSILYSQSPSVSENCLYLNVWTPAAGASDKRPVMMLIYGGGNTQGAASRPAYDGAGLARKGAVVVSFNFRAGVLGWLAHPELSAESPNKVSGNYALLDQIAALQWVKANIAGFGGDPDKVTLYSQSAGAGNVHVLMASPLAKGLFHRAVLGSGGVSPSFRGDTRTLAQAEQAGVAFATNTAKAANLAALRAMQASDLQAISNSYAAGETVDGYLLPDQVAKRFRSGQAADIPVIAGFTADEATVQVPAGFATTLAGFQSGMQGLVGALAPEVLAFYRVSDDATAFALRHSVVRDFQFGWQPYTVARSVAARHSAKAWVYWFNRVPPYFEDQRNYTEGADPVALGAYHTIEQVYLYNNLSQWPRPYTAIDTRLADIASTYLVNFATSSDPNLPLTTTAAGNSLPPWPAIAASGGQAMGLGDVVVPVAVPYQAAFEFFDSIYTRMLGRPLAFQ